MNYSRASAAPLRVRRAGDSAHQQRAAMDGILAQVKNGAPRMKNVLNSLPGVWARADLGKRTAAVRARQLLDHDRLRQAMRQSEYIVTQIKTV